MRKSIIATSILFLSLLSCSLTPNLTATAMTYEEHHPSFSLYCEENVIKSEKVSYKISTVADNKISGDIHYKIEGEQGQEYVFYIPMNCRYFEAPQYDIKIDGISIPLEFMYGESTTLYKSDASIKNAIERSSLGKVDETITGTLYKFTANSSKMTVSFDLTEKQSVIFQNGGSNLQSTSGINGYSYTVDTTANEEYTMFVTNGDLLEVSATATYTKESKTCKEYIEENYYPNEEFYQTVQIPIELLYAKMSKQLNKKGMVDYNDFFWEQQNYNLNFYKFSIVLSNPSMEISYTEKTEVRTNARYEPMIYLFERVTSANYPTEYNVETTQELPYIIENNVGLKESNGLYTATSSGDSFYCIYSSKSKSVSKYEENQPPNTWLIVGISVVSVLVVVSITGIVIYKKKKSV